MYYEWIGFLDPQYIYNRIKQRERFTRKHKAALFSACAEYTRGEIREKKKTCEESVATL